MSVKAKNTEGSNDKALRRWRVACGILLLAFLVAVGWAIYQERSYEKYVEQKLNEYPLVDPSRNFIPQEHFITNIQPVRERFREMVAQFEQEGGDVSLYFEFLNTGANISINQEKYLFPASLTKVPIALIAMKKVERGEWSLSNELVLMQGDANYQSGKENNMLAEWPMGTRFTIEKLLEELLVNSDNTAAAIFLRNFSEDDRLALVDEVGLQDLFTQGGRYSAKEYSRFFRTLYTSSFLRRENSQKILQWLDEVPFNEFLSNPIPKEVPFAHKWGTGGNGENKFYSDSGIVYLSNRPYLLTVIIEGDRSEEFEQRATQLMRVVSKEAYDYFSTYAH